MWERNWGWTILRGVAAIIFGLLALLMPGITWIVLMGFFAAYALISGIAAVVSAMSTERPQDRPWGWLFLEGVLGMALAVLWVLWPARVSLGFLYVIGTWAILTGVLEIGTAIRLRREIRNEWMLALSGLLSLAFGVLVWMHPFAGALAVVWWIGAYAIVFGGLLVGLGFRMRHIAAETPRRHHGLPLDGRLRHQT
jgi:uncharacterized membrane protein HdeD (DUF308 family)